MEDGCCCGVAMFDAIRFHNFLGCFVCLHHTLCPPSFSTLSCPLSLLKPSYSCLPMVFVVHMWGLRCSCRVAGTNVWTGWNEEGKRVLLGPKPFIFACHTTILVSLPLTLFLALAHVPTPPQRQARALSGIHFCFPPLLCPLPSLPTLSFPSTTREFKH